MSTFPCSNSVVVLEFPSSSRVASWNIFTVSHHVDIILMHLIFLLASFSLNLHRRWVPHMISVINALFMATNFYIHITFTFFQHSSFAAL